MIPEKLSPIERALQCAAQKPPHEARKILMLICESGMTMDSPVNQPMSEGAKHYAKREKTIKEMHSSCGRVLKYAKHETLRNIEKHFRTSPPIHGAEDDPTEPSGSLAARLTFKPKGFREELLAALREEASLALTVAGQQLFDELGRDDPWKMPGTYSTGFLNYRENLLKDVPDEVHKTIMEEIQAGLNAGDSRKELMNRISTKFDETYKGRFETVANTETAAAFNFARDRAMKEAGVTHKKWLLSHSPLIKEHRITHEENDGQVRLIDEPFDIGGVQFMYPGDDTLGAGPEDIINCHCVAIPVEGPVKSGEGEGHPFRGNQYTTVRTAKTNPEFEATVHDELHSALKDFPDVYRDIDKIDFTRGDIGSAEVFSHLGKRGDPKETMLAFGNFYSSQKPGSPLAKLSGTFSDNDLRGTVRHESGHLIWDYIRNRTPEAEKSSLYDFAKSAPVISEYAKTSPLEAVAELSDKVLSGRGTKDELKWWDGLKQRYKSVEGKKLIK